MYNKEKRQVQRSITEQEIIPVEQSALGLMVSSLLLHQKLGIATPHWKWIRRRIGEYGFKEGRDLRTKLSVSPGGRKMTDYILTLDTAKELAMVEKSEAGRAVRYYFIETEKRYRDWSGLWLPKLETDVNLFDSRTGYSYGQLLLALGCCTSKGAFYARIKRNRQEFWRDQSMVWYVSESYGKNIILYCLARKGSVELKQRREETFFSPLASDLCKRLEQDMKITEGDFGKYRK
jgi:phage anti-repressor protein